MFAKPGRRHCCEIEEKGVKRMRELMLTYSIVPMSFAEHRLSAAA